MGDLVDRGRIRSTRLVANPECGKYQDGPSLSQLDAEDHAEFSVRGWQPQLHAMPERSPLRSLLFADEKVLNGHPFCLELFAGRKRHLFPRIACSPQIVGKGGVIE